MDEREKKVLLAQLMRAHDLSDEFLDCRSLRHAWQEVETDQKVLGGFGDPHTYQCSRCLTLRDDVISPRFGELLGRAYRYAPGYRQEAPEDGTRLFSAAALRAERVRRIMQLDRQLPPITPLPVAA